MPKSNNTNYLKIIFYPLISAASAVFGAIVQLVLSFIKPSLVINHYFFVLGIILAVFCKAAYHSFKNELGLIDIVPLAATALTAILYLHVNPLLMIFPYATLFLLPFLRKIDLGKLLNTSIMIFAGIAGYFNYSVIFIQTFAPGANILTAIFMPNLAILLTSTAFTAIAALSGYFLHRSTKTYKYRKIGPNDMLLEIKP